MGIGEFFSCSGLRNYVFATVDLVGQWRGHDNALASKIFGIAKEYIQIYDAFEAFTTIKAKRKDWLESNYLGQATTVMNWTNSVCEGIDFLKLRNIVQLSSEGDRVLSWFVCLTGGLGPLFTLAIFGLDMMGVAQGKREVSKIVVLDALVAISGDVSSLALAVLNSPIFDKYDVKSAKLYLNTGLVVSRWVSFAIRSCFTP